MRWKRWIRSSLSTGLTWAAAWSIGGVIISPFFARNISAGSTQYAMSAIICGGISGWYGFLAGLIFSVVVIVASRRRPVEELSISKFGAWGIVASLLCTIPPTLYMVTQRRDGWRTEDLTVISVAALMCAGCAVGTLLLARRGATLERSRKFFALSAAQSREVVYDGAQTVREKTTI